MVEVIQWNAPAKERLAVFPIGGNVLLSSRIEIEPSVVFTQRKRKVPETAMGLLAGKMRFRVS